MSSQPRLPASCQLASLPTGTRSLSPLDHARQLLLRMLSAVERRARRWNLNLRGLPLEGASAIHEEGAPVLNCGEVVPGEGFRPGDLVRVRSLEEIRTTLDERSYCDGLEFMESMADHCGQALVVLKRVHFLYDEGERRMLRVKRPRYILDGAICHGTNAYDREGCDRSCFFFWSPRWLRRVDR